MSTQPPTLILHHGDNLPILKQMEDCSIDLIYIDPPFNTGKSQRYTRTKTVRDDSGDRVGFQGARYRTVEVGENSYEDRFSDFLAFIGPRLEEAHRILKPSGSLFFHLDWREIHRCRILLDEMQTDIALINMITTGSQSQTDKFWQKHLKQNVFENSSDTDS